MNRTSWRTCSICGERKKASDMARNWRGTGEHYYADYCKVCKPIHDKNAALVRIATYTVVSDASRTYSPGATFSQIDLDEGVPLHAFDGVTFKLRGKAFHACGGRLWVQP